MSWLGEPPVQGCTGGVWGALDGRYQTGAGMASRIKARGLKGRALAPLIGRLLPSLYVNTAADRRTKPYTITEYKKGPFSGAFKRIPAIRYYLAAASSASPSRTDSSAISIMSLKVVWRSSAVVCSWVRIWSETVQIVSAFAPNSAATP